MKQVVHGVSIFSVVRDIGYFTFLYPLTMSVIWVVGGLYFWWRRERKYEKGVGDGFLPPVTILVPCHNEAVSVEATCQALSILDYPDYRVVFIDDASTDCTAEIIRSSGISKT